MTTTRSTTPSETTTYIDNRTAGVMLEISYDGLVQGNTVLGSGIRPSNPSRWRRWGFTTYSRPVAARSPAHRHPPQVSSFATTSLDPSPIPTPRNRAASTNSRPWPLSATPSPRRPRQRKRRHALWHPNRNHCINLQRRRQRWRNTSIYTSRNTSPTTTTPHTDRLPSDGRHPADPQTVGSPSASGNKPAWTQPTPPLPQPATTLRTPVNGSALRAHRGEFGRPLVGEEHGRGRPTGVGDTWGWLRRRAARRRCAAIGDGCCCCRLLRSVFVLLRHLKVDEKDIADLPGTRGGRSKRCRWIPRWLAVSRTGSLI